MTFSGTCIKINWKRQIKFERIPNRETFWLIIAISRDNVIWINFVTSLMSYISTLLRLTCSSQQPIMNFTYMHTFKCLLMLIFHVNKFSKKIWISELKFENLRASLFIWVHNVNYLRQAAYLKNSLVKL